MSNKSSDTTDFAVYGNIRLPILHHHHGDLQVLAERLYQDGQRSIQMESQGMAFHHFGDRRYLVMSGEGSRNSESLWSWRLMELRGPDEQGMAMTPAHTFDSVPDRHYAPVAFMDKDYSDGDREVTFQVFRPSDRIHYPLSATGYAIQKAMMTIARPQCSGEYPSRWLDN